MGLSSRMAVIGTISGTIDHVHNHHHGWYHGAWCDNWGGGWYTPFVYGATAWGLAATLPAWGYNYGYSYSYSNPYYVASATPAYDYSQPIVINTYNTPTADASADASPEQTTTATQESTQVAEGYKVFDAAREAFAKGDYSQALELDEQAIRYDRERSGVARVRSLVPLRDKGITAEPRRCLMRSWRCLRGWTGRP